MKQKIICYLGLLLALLCVGCQNPKQAQENRPNTAQDSESMDMQETDNLSDENESDEEMFLILSLDSTTETLRVYRYATKLEYQYHYSIHTRFLDQYGKLSSAAKFGPGKVVHIGTVGTDGKLDSLQLADEVWEYDDVYNFKWEEEKGIFKIADVNYKYGEASQTFSGDHTISVSELTENDTISVIGIDKEILSITVTTGHGILKLNNTELFEDSFLQLNTNMFVQITPEMSIEIPEGSYQLAVANNGWGGSCEIEILRGETTEIDLDLLKGEGPKYGDILFVIDVLDAILCIDGEVVDYSEPVHLQYGKHQLVVDADGYEQIMKYLFVNSEEATILIDLGYEENAGDKTPENTPEDTQAQEDTQTESETQSTEESETEATDTQELEDEILSDYVSTLTELIGGL